MRGLSERVESAKLHMLLHLLVARLSERVESVKLHMLPHLLVVR